MAEQKLSRCVTNDIRRFEIILDWLATKQMAVGVKLGNGYYQGVDVANLTKAYTDFLLEEEKRHHEWVEEKRLKNECLLCDKGDFPFCTEHDPDKEE